MAGYISRDPYRPPKGYIEPRYEATLITTRVKARCTGVELRGVFVSPETLNVLNLLTKTKTMSIGQAIDNMVKRQYDIK